MTLIRAICRALGGLRHALFVLWLLGLTLSMLAGWREAGALAALCTLLAAIAYPLLQTWRRRLELQQAAFVALQRSEQLWQELAHRLPELVWGCDAHGQVNFLNQRWADYTGQSVDGPAHRGMVLAVVHPDDAEQLWAAWEQALCEQQPLTAECRFRRRDGAYRWFRISGVPVRDAQGQVLRWVGANSDIDDLRQAEGRLRELLQHQEERVAARTAELERARRDLRNLLNAVPLVIGYWDHQLVNRFANRAYEAWTGLDPDTIPGRTLDEVMGAAAAQLRPRFEAALRGEPQSFERHAIDVAGRHRHLQVHYRPDVHGGQVCGVYVVVHDMTDLMESRHALVQERERLRDILRGTNVGTWEWNVQTGELRIDERWAGILGRELQALLPATNQTWQSLTHPEDAAHSLELYERHARGETEFFESESRMRHREGHWVWVRSTARIATRTAEGQPEWVQGIHQDITRAREAQEKIAAGQAVLEQAKQAAEAANAAKSEFLSTMSHEIRTPMNAILGTVQVLERSGLDVAQQRLVEGIRMAGDNLLALVNDVLDLARIESGHLDLERRPFVLSEVLSGVLKVLRPLAQAKGLALELQPLPPGLPPLLGDARRLGQMLYNLVGNALKFTEAGRVVVTVQRLRDEGSRVALRLSVRDTGVGIAAEQLDRIFDAFVQADSSISRRFGGTGLGLAICRRVAALMGAQIGARSEPGVGSEFWLHAAFDAGVALPALAAPAAPPASARSTRRLAGLRVLAVDDAPLNLQIVQRLLEFEGAACVTAGHGEEALQLLLADPAGTDVVLMDVQMPVLDGIEATRRLRAEPALARLPVIALTAGALSSQREQALQAGMSDFLAKPFSLDGLVELLLRHRPPHLAQAHAAVPVAAVAAEAPVDVEAGTFPAVAGIDHREAFERLLGNLPLFHSMLRALREDFGDVVEAVRADVAQGDPAGAARRLHKLRGVAGNVSALRVAEQALALESALRSGSLDGFDRLLEGLDVALRTVREGMPTADEAVAAGAPPQASPVPAAVTVPDVAGVSRLLAALRAHSAAALGQFESLRPALAARHGVQALAPLVRALEELRFEVAAELLQAWYPQA